MTSALLEVVALHEADAEAAQEGGADRLEITAPASAGSTSRVGLSPEPALVSSIVRSVDIPVRAVLRLNDGFSTTGGEVSRLVGLAQDYLSAGAEGLVLGFLNADLDVDVQVVNTLMDEIGRVPWTFHRAIDSSLDYALAWRQVRPLPGLDAVLTAGSVLGVDHGEDDLVEIARSSPEVAAMVLAGGGLRAEHVPWLVRAGIRQFHLGSSVRPGGSWTKSYVDTSYVRSWRLLVDDEAQGL